MFPPCTSNLYLPLRVTNRIKEVLLHKSAQPRTCFNDDELLSQREFRESQLHFLNIAPMCEKELIHTYHASGHSHSIILTSRRHQIHPHSTLSTQLPTLPSSSSLSYERINNRLGPGDAKFFVIHLRYKIATRVNLACIFGFVRTVRTTP
jgi:hypothetical protein